MAGISKPTASARRNARAILADRHAQQLARMQADEADLAAFVERQHDITTAEAALSAALERATRHRHRELTTALAQFRVALEHDSDDPSGEAEASELAVLAAALDSGADIYRTTVLAAAVEAAATTAVAREEQRRALRALRARGMSVADLAAATELSSTRVARWLKHRTETPTPDESTPASSATDTGTDSRQRARTDHTATASTSASAVSTPGPSETAAVMDSAAPEDTGSA